MRQESQSCQVCGVLLAADPEGPHASSQHTLCWTHWRERNDVPPPPAVDLGAQTRERIVAAVGRLEERLAGLEYRLRAIETATGLRARGITHAELLREGGRR